MSAKKVVVTGAGASGILAAVMAAKEGAAVTLIEQNDRIGKKICATGNGKCNLTNENMKAEYIHCNDKKFVEIVLKNFSRKDTMDFFQSAGLCFVNKNGYFYPRSEQAQSVVNILQSQLIKYKVKIKTNEKVVNIQQPRFQGDTWKIITKGWKYEADSLILANGSKASAIAGSDGSGYELAKSLGYHVTEPLPALVPLKCKGIRFSSWAGVRTSGRVRLYVHGQMVGEAAGELQLTDYGVSGIPVFQVSSLASRALFEGEKVRIQLDFMPEMEKEALEKFIQERKQRFPEKTMPQILEGIFPDKLIRVLTEQKNPVEAIKDLTLYVTGTGSFEKAQICCGGVALDQIDAQTMESRLHPGLYFCGELLDADGLCGGYNLQWAWSTGAIAGRSAGQLIG